MNGTFCLRRPSISAVRSRLVLQMMPSAIMAFAIAQWCCMMLGAARVQTVVIAFAWAAVTGHQLVTSRRREQVQRFLWTPDLILSALGGQMLWVVLPLVQFAHPESWYCVPVTIPPALVATGAIVAICWPLRPFVMRRQPPDVSARYLELDAPVLYGSFFLLSGNLVFAAAVYASIVILLARRVKWEELTPTLRDMIQTALDDTSGVIAVRPVHSA
jgi:hypothetical protein